MKENILYFWRYYIDLPLIRKIGFLLLGLSFLIFEVGLFRYYQSQISWTDLIKKLMDDYYANVSTDFFGTALTILIIDAIYERRDQESEKRDLALQMGSPDNAFAREAVRRLKIRGWLNEVLRRVDFSNANLDGVDLSGTDLSDMNMNGGIFTNSRLVRTKLNYSNLRGADLQGADLLGCELTQADLQKAKLCQANLTSAVMEKANLQQCDMRGAILVGANLSGANLSWANLEMAEMMNVNLDRADLSSAEIRGVLGLQNKWLLVHKIINNGGGNEDFSGKDFENAYLRGVYLVAADFSSANLVSVDLSKSILDSIDFTETRLDNSSLSNASIKNSKFTRASLKGVDFSNANLENADFTGADLTGAIISKEQLSQASSLFHVILPNGRVVEE